MFSLFWRILKPQFSVFERTHHWLTKNEIPNLSLPEMISTNDKAKEEAFSISAPMRVYLADQQMKGRGRGQNSWSNTAPGHSLMMSFSFHMERPAQPIATPLVGLALAKALSDSFDLKHLSIKAPNDILVNGEKLAGLLVEAVQMGEQNRLIIGLGLNVFSAPENLSNCAFLLNEVRVSKKSWAQFMKTLLSEMRLASQEAMGSHLSDHQRAELLEFLNQNPHISEQYESLSPFGDLSTKNKVVSWRDL